MLERLEDKVIAIAGGCGIVGGGVTKRLAAEGATVVLGDLDIAAAEALAGEIIATGGRVTPLKLDIGDEASVNAFVETAVKLHGGLDGFHVNAVAPSRGLDDDILTIDMAEYDRLMHVNQRGYVLCTRAAVPALLERGRGCMLYTSSGAAHGALATLPVYSMAKSGVHALMRHIATRYGERHIRSNVIAPGRIVSPDLAANTDHTTVQQSVSLTRLKAHGAPKDIAAIAALLLSDDGEFITGQVISVDGGTTVRP